MPQRPPHFGLTAPTCPFCDTRITVHEKINAGHCGTVACTSRYAVRDAQRRDAERRKEAQDRLDAVLVREALTIARAARMLNAEPGTALVAPVPFQNKPVVPLPRDVRETLVAHIRDIVAAAFEDLEQASGHAVSEPPSLGVSTPVEAAGCTACQGYCCSFGRQSRAFLNKTVMASLIRAEPDLNAPDMVDRYVAAIPDRSVEDACAYQSAKGCTLPRDWRSDTCNTYRCEALVAMAARAQAVEDLPLIIVGISEEGSKLVAHRDSLGTTAV